MKHVGHGHEATMRSPSNTDPFLQFRNAGNLRVMSLSLPLLLLGAVTTSTSAIKMVITERSIWFGSAAVIEPMV